MLAGLSRTKLSILVGVGGFILLAAAGGATWKRLITEAAHPPAAHQPSAGLLPGEKMLPGGVSSYLFGINETYDYAEKNLENTPSAQQALKHSGFTLVRTFFNYNHNEWPYDHKVTTDADIERRLAAIEKSGAQCLGVLAVSNEPDYNSPLSFLDHLLTYAETTGRKDRCLMWEFGNEPDMSVQQYLALWNKDIPYLRARHPKAKFIGPVMMAPYFDKMQEFLLGVKQSGVLPDAISYHDYPCYSEPDYYISHDATNVDEGQECDDHVVGTHGSSGFARTIKRMKQLIHDTLGRDLPVGVTEWNVSPNFVNYVSVNGQNYLPLSADAVYQERFIPEIYQAMAEAHLDFANVFDAYAGAGEGTAGSLDLFDWNGNPKPWYATFTATIAGYKKSAH